MSRGFAPWLLGQGKPATARARVISSGSFSTPLSSSLPLALSVAPSVTQMGGDSHVPGSAVLVVAQEESRSSDGHWLLHRRPFLLLRTLIRLVLPGSFFRLISGDSGPLFFWEGLIRSKRTSRRCFRGRWCFIFYS